VNGSTKLGSFAAAAVLTMGGAAAVGAAVGPFDSTNHSDHQEAPMPSTTATMTHQGHTSSAAGYVVHPEVSVLSPDRPGPITFKVLDPSGAAVTSFEDRHERPMHLILVSSDLTSYYHLHPTLAEDGTWTASLPGLAPGGYRLIADSVPSGAEGQILTTDLLVPGAHTPIAVPGPSPTSSVDGFEVRMDLAGSGDGSTATFTVQRDGSTLAPDPYLGARGHLVAIDAEDLGYLHVHPDGATGPAVGFTVAGTEPGRYRLFFDFSVDGQVHTAAFTVDLGQPSAPATGHAHEEEHR
jgi:hypothetical protein